MEIMSRVIIQLTTLYTSFVYTDQNVDIIETIVKSESFILKMGSAPSGAEMENKNHIDSLNFCCDHPQSIEPEEH